MKLLSPIPIADCEPCCSALVTSQAQQGRSTAALCHCNFVDISVALGIALLINVAVTVVAAETFHARGVIVLTLQVRPPQPPLSGPSM